jgi:hypothetical protein
MADIYEELENWFKDRPKWIQETAKLLIENESLTEEHIASLFKLCGQESKGENIPFRNIHRSELCYGESKEVLRLIGITGVRGVNALSPRKPLLFGDGSLSIVFGNNGSGKSGYSRTLKHICGAKHLGELLGNVFKKEVEKISCSLKVSKDGVVNEIHWEPSKGIIKELSGVEIFDSSCADVYATKENEAAYEPFILRLFSRIIEVCTILSDRYEQAIKARPSKKPAFPIPLVNTKAATWYGKIDHKTTEPDIASNTSWSELEEAELGSLSERLAIANPIEQAKKIRREKKNLTDLLQLINSLESSLGEAACKEIIVSQSSARIKREIVQKEAKRVFENSSITGVGTETWKAMWEAARKYSNVIAYKDLVFPNTSESAQCVLCQQPLSASAKSSFISFETFVSGELEKSASDAERLYSEAIAKLPSVPTKEEVSKNLDAANVSEESVRNSILAAFEDFRKRGEWIASATSMENITQFRDFDFKTQLSGLESNFDQRAQKFEADSKAENRTALEAKRTELQGKKWLFQQVKAVQEEVTRLATIEKLKKAKLLAATQQLSTKKSALSEELLSAEYLKRFQAELKLLGGSRLNAEIVRTKTEKGKVFHQLVLKGRLKSGSVDEILSHGEYRLVSLAAFLADAAGRGNSSPFIFDDPISSLDQDYEESLVARLIEISKSRQVIVFTHRLSLFALLTEQSKKQGVSTSEICIRAENWGKGEPSETPMFAKNPGNALSGLRDHRLPVAKRALTENGGEAYEYVAKGICSDFRILIERVIEFDLMADVVARFRRGVTTMGKIDKLSKIQSSDCKFLDDIMTKYSKYEHSQPQELPTELPQPEELEADIKSVIEWRDKFLKRSEKGFESTHDQNTATKTKISATIA